VDIGGDQTVTRPVRFAELSWSEIARRLATDTRVVVPLGATEEHGDLSLTTDTTTVEHICHEACTRLDLLMSPTMPFGCSAFAINFPGTLSLRTSTLCGVVEDMVDCLFRQGFRRIAFVTGHGGNEVITGTLSEVQLDRPQLSIYYTSLYTHLLPAVKDVEAELGAQNPGDHASWYEAFEFNRVGPIASRDKSLPQDPDYPSFPLNPRTARRFLDDGVIAGRAVPPSDEALERVRAACVEGLTGFLQAIPKWPARD
jgi:creatinine amidohydrolase